MKNRNQKNASALVIALVMIVLITILVLGFVTTARLDVSSSRLHLDGVKADILSQTAEEVALARLKAATTVAGRSWISQPGRIVVSPVGAVQPLTNVVELSSGWSPNNASSNETVNLNLRLLENTNELLLAPTNIFGTNSPEMRVRWIYVRKDGTFDTSVPPAYNANNPIEGRMAFWVDDESSKIDMNTAWTRDPSNTNTLSHPSQVNLGDLLSSTEASNVAQYRLTQFFNSPDEPKRVDTNVAALWSSNKFSLAYYSQAPGWNMFGEQRILLTTRKSVAESIYGVGTTNYFNICTVDNSDPGTIASLNGTKVTALAARLVSLFERTDWPIAPGTSLEAKYISAGNTNIAWQMAADLIDYVRSRESTAEVVAPIRMSYTSATKAQMQTSGDHIEGMTRRPLMTEIGIWFGAHNSNGSKLKVELYLPQGSGSIDLSKLTFDGQVCADTVTTVGANLFAAPLPIKRGPAPATPDAAAVYTDGDTIMTNGSYRTLMYYSPTYLRGPGITTTPGSNAPTTVHIRLWVNTTDGGELVPVSDASTNLLTYKPDATASESTIPSISVNDPYVNKRGADWVQGASSFGAPNPGSTLGGPPDASIKPPQDTDGNKISDASMRMPPPKGQPGNIFGLVESVGELGFVHTGIDCYMTPGTPWRTFRLQPQEAGSRNLPDWAFLDLFAAPVTTSAWEQPVVLPGTNGTVGGRININGQLAPFVNTDGNAMIARAAPLAALLSGATNSSGSTISSLQALAVATNILQRNLATSGNPGTNYADTNIYYSPWQLAEIAGISDSGESSEIVLRQVGALATARGDVFSIYSIGQAVRQSSTGNITVLSEHRGQRIVERTGSASPVYQTVFSRELVP